MRRRALLRAAPLATLGLTGCVGTQSEQGAATVPRASLRMEPIDARGVTTRLHRQIESGSPPADLLTQVRTNGSATNERIRPSLHDDDLVVFSDTLYRVQVSVTEQVPALVVPITLNDLAYEGVTIGPDDESIRFSELPAVDRRVFRDNKKRWRLLQWTIPLLDRRFHLCVWGIRVGLFLTGPTTAPASCGYSAYRLLTSRPL